MSQIPIGWLINRGIWRNPFNNREMMIDGIPKGHYCYEPLSGMILQVNMDVVPPKTWDFMVKLIQPSPMQKRRDVCWAIMIISAQKILLVDV